MRTLVVASAALILASCGGADSAADRPGLARSQGGESTTIASGPQDEPGRDAPEYVGLSEADAQSLAKSKGMQVRICRQGEPCGGSTDLRDDRVNLYVDNDVVQKARVF